MNLFLIMMINLFNQCDPNVKAAIAFLKLLKIKINNATINETLQNHPDWPSLLCISDSLNKWNIPNGAAKTEASQLNELPNPFIAYTYNREYPLAIVVKTDDNSVQCYSKNYSNLITEIKEDFLKTKTSIYLIAEPGAQAGEKDYLLNKRKAFVRMFVNVAGIYGQYFILLAELMVTSLSLLYENYGLFAQKYLTNGELARQGNKIEAMDKWCKAMEVYATPVFFINGNQLPMPTALRI